jgi:hypothetical protein
MFSVRSCLSIEWPISHRIVRQIARSVSKDRQPKSVAVSQSSSSYQSSFSSFWDMIHKEKADSKSYLLIEDLCASIEKQSLRNMSRILDSSVCQIDKYMIGKRGFTLVKLDDYKDFLRKGKPIYPDQSFPVRSRLLLLRSFPRNEDRSPLPVRDALKTNADISAILSERDVEEAIDKLVSSTRMSRFGSKLRFFLMNQIEEVICTGVFSEFHFLPYGSSVNHFGSDNSDLDMAMDLKEEPETRTRTNQHSGLVYQSKPIMSDRFQSQRLVDFVGDHMQFFMPGISNLQRIPRARVPIIKLHSEMTGLDCDVSFQSARVSVKMAEAFYEYCAMDDRVLKLVCFIKIWAKQHSLTNVNPGPWYTNFMLMLMIIHFFQTRAGFRLPPMNNLRAHIPHQDEDKSFVSILREFLEFISSYNYGKYAMSVLNGRMILKPSHTAIHIENPLEPDLNVSVNVDLSEVKRLVTAANTSLAILMNSDPYTLSDLCKPTTKPTVFGFNVKNAKGIQVYEYLAE